MGLSPDTDGCLNRRLRPLSVSWSDPPSRSSVQYAKPMSTSLAQADRIRPSMSKAGCPYAIMRKRESFSRRSRKRRYKFVSKYNFEEARTNLASLIHKRLTPSVPGQRLPNSSLKATFDQLTCTSKALTSPLVWEKRVQSNHFPAIVASMNSIAPSTGQMTSNPCPREFIIPKAYPSLGSLAALHYRCSCLH